MNHSHVFTGRSCDARCPGELKPCPFCGSEDVSMTHYYSGVIDGYSYSIRCESCQAQVGQYLRKEKALEIWNTRYERTCYRVLDKVKYGTRLSKCSECGYGLGAYGFPGSGQWVYCPNCGAKVVDE